jgi:hypothetical protein
MIALIAYHPQQERTGRQYHRDYDSRYLERMFEYWHRYYKLSGTSLDFKIFTDPFSGIENLGGFKVHQLDTDPPITTATLAYSDWLKSEIFDVINEPFVYMDLDCIMLKSIDDIFGYEGDFLMFAENAGVLLFRKSFKEEFQSSLIRRALRRGVVKNRLGEFTWSGIKQIHGGDLPYMYNYRGGDPYTFFEPVPDDVKVIHMLNGTCQWFFAYHEYFRKCFPKQ